MSKRTKILLAIRQGQVGGGETHVFELASRINKDLFDVEVLAFTPGVMIEKLNKIGIKTHVIATTKPFNVFVWPKVLRLIKSKGFDMIHAHGTRAASNVMFIAKYLNIPLVYTIHGWSFHKSQSTITRISRTLSEQLITYISDLNIAVSESNRQEGMQIGVTKIKLIHNGIDLQKFNPNSSHQDIRKELGIASNHTLIGYFARITEQKDPATMINAFELLCKKTKDISLLMVGNGNLKNTISNMVNEAGLSKQVFLADFRDDVPALLKATDIYCLPSLWEGMPIALIEAMAMEKACVCTAVDGTKELITDGENGITVPVQDPEKLAEAIRSLHRNISLRNKLGKKARETVSNIFSVQQMVKSTEAMYHEVLSSLQPILIKTHA